MSTAHMENWSITKIPKSPYQAPEEAVSRLQGTITEHERVPDGIQTYTSTIMSVDTDNEIPTWVETRNTRYTLGTIDPLWMKWIGEQGYTIKDFIDPIVANRG